MIKLKIFTAFTLGLMLVACSDSNNNQAAKSESATISQNMSQNMSQTPAHPPAQQGAAPQGQQQLSQAQLAALAAAKDLPKEGKVLEMMHAAGYTYMKVDAGTDSPMWIAASMMRVKPEQNVKWTDAAVMSNFTSKSLHRTFDKILFVSNAQVIE